MRVDSWASCFVSPQALPTMCAVRSAHQLQTLLRALLEVKGLRPTEAEPAFGQAPCGRVVGTSSCERHCPVAAFL